MASMGERSFFIDIAKGLGIFLVVIGHANVPLGLGFLVFLFHMPFFFFISGMLYSPRPVLEYWRHKTLSLMVPYFIFLLAFSVPRTWGVLFHTTDLSAAQRAHEIFHMTLRSLYGGKMLVGDTGVFWFVSCLYFTQQLYNLAYFRARLRRIPLLIFIAVLYASAYFSQTLFPNILFPLAVNSAAMATVFYYAGHQTGIYLPEVLERMGKNKVKILAVSSLIAFGLLAIGSQLPFLRFNMKLCNYGTPGLTLLLNLCGIFLVLCLTKACQKLRGSAALLAELGKASMFIMYLHRPIQIRLENHLWAQVFVSLSAALLFYYFCKKFSATRAIFRINPSL